MQLRLAQTSICFKVLSLITECWFHRYIPSWMALCSKSRSSWAGVAQWLRTLALLAENLSSVPSTHMVWLTCACNSSYRGTSSGSCTYLYTHYLLNCSRHLHILHINFLTDTQFSNIFFHLVADLCTFLVVSLQMQQFNLNGIYFFFQYHI